MFIGAQTSDSETVFKDGVIPKQLTLLIKDEGLEFNHMLHFHCGAYKGKNINPVCLSNNLKN